MRLLSRKEFLSVTVGRDEINFFFVVESHYFAVE